MKKFTKTSVLGYICIIAAVGLLAAGVHARDDIPVHHTDLPPHYTLELNSVTLDWRYTEPTVPDTTQFFYTNKQEAIDAAWDNYKVEIRDQRRHDNQVQSNWTKVK